MQGDQGNSFHDAMTTRPRTFYRIIFDNASLDTVSLGRYVPSVPTPDTQSVVDNHNSYSQIQGRDTVGVKDDLT